MDVLSPWCVDKLPSPPITTKKYNRASLTQFAIAGGHRQPEPWITELRNTLLQLNNELNQKKMNSLAYDAEFINQITRQKFDLRAEKFYPKMKQAGHAAAKVCKYCTAKLVDNVGELMKPLPPAFHLQEYRLVPGPLFRHTLLHLARDYNVLQQVVCYCEQAGKWLKFKMNIGQRCGLSLALFAVISRICTVSLELQLPLLAGYEKLANLVDGLEDARGEKVTKDLPSSLDQHIQRSSCETGNGSSAVTSESLITSIFGDRFNQSTEEKQEPSSASNGIGYNDDIDAHSPSSLQKLQCGDTLMQDVIIDCNDDGGGDDEAFDMGEVISRPVVENMENSINTKHKNQTDLFLKKKKKSSINKINKILSKSSLNSTANESKNKSNTCISITKNNNNNLSQTSINSKNKKCLSEISINNNSKNKSNEHKNLFKSSINGSSKNNNSNNNLNNSSSKNNNSSSSSDNNLNNSSSKNNNLNNSSSKNNNNSSSSDNNLNNSSSKNNNNSSSSDNSLNNSSSKNSNSSIISNDSRLNNRKCKKRKLENLSDYSINNDEDNDEMPVKKSTTISSGSSSAPNKKNKKKKNRNKELEDSFIKDVVHSRS